MEIVNVRISNILGIEYFEFKAGKFTKISGKNGAGKTSVLEAIKAVFKKGNDATIIRKGEKTGEVVLELSDGTEIRKTFSDKSTLSVIDGNGDVVSKPDRYLQIITDMVSINPINFLYSDSKKRTDMLLDALPLKVTELELRELIGEYYPDQVSGISLIHALEAIAKIHKAIYDERTAENRSIKQTESTITELSASLIHAQVDPSINLKEKIAELESTQAAMNQMLSGYYAEYNTEKALKLESNDDYKNNEICKIGDTYLTKLQILNEERDRSKQVVINKYNIEVEKINAEYISKTADKKTKFDEKHDALVAQLTKFRSVYENQTAYNKQFEYIQKLQNDLDIYRTKSEGLTNALNLLTNKKSDMLQELPIKGLEIKEGQIYCNDILFDRLNTAQQIDISVEIAKLKAGELGFICVDGIERLDDEALKTFQEKSEKSGLQLIVTQVSNDNQLKIDGDN